MLKSTAALLLALLILSFSANPAQTQPALPLPARDTVEVLIGGDFEADTDGDKIPDGWTGKKTSLPKADKRKCNKPEASVAHSGECAFMFRGNPGGTSSKLMQTISDVSALVDGAAVQFSAYIDPRNSTPGTAFAKAKISLSDGSKVTLKLSIPEADDYVQVTENTMLDLAGLTVTQVKVQFMGKQAKGKFLIDAASLNVTTPDLPTTTPENTDIPNTPTVTPTVTHTPTQTPIPEGLKLIPGDINTVGQASFGSAIAIESDTLMIGAPDSTVGENNLQGAVYIFVRNGDTWIEQQKLTASDGEANDLFGASVAISGDTMIVGSPQSTANEEEFQGAVYIFVRSGNTWIEQQKLTASEVLVGEYFGSNLDISGDTIIVGVGGANIEANVDQGAVYVFTRTDNLWAEQQKLTASDGAANDWFGSSVAIDDDTLIIGAPLKTIDANVQQGAVYVFTRTDNLWAEQQQLTASDSAANIRFGIAATLSADTAVIGAYNDNFNATDRPGAVYVFSKDNTWLEQQKLTASDAADNDTFGTAVALLADSIVVGAYGKETDSLFAGAVYFFNRTGGSWSQEHIFNAPSASSDFGYTVAMNIDHIMIGVPLDFNGWNAGLGSVRVFPRP